VVARRAGIAAAANATPASSNMAGIRGWRTPKPRKWLDGRRSAELVLFAAAPRGACPVSPVAAGTSRIASRGPRPTRGARTPRRRPRLRAREWARECRWAECCWRS
jgi:hypothetical protein